MGDERLTAPTCPHHEDACELRARRALSETAHTKVFHGEEPQAVPQGCDTATPAFIAEHGTLYECASCGYRTRAHVDAAPAAAVVGN